MKNILEQFLFSTSVTGPICLMLALGVFLKRTSIINDGFVTIASKVVFQVTLPVMLFLSILRSQHDLSSSVALVIYGLAANFLFFLFTTICAKTAFQYPQDQGVIIQGSFRANTAIIALAYVANIYGEGGLAMTAIYIATTTVLYNIQAVIALTPNDGISGVRAIGKVSEALIKNPLNISVLLGAICYWLSVSIPKIVIDAGEYLASMTLPLALLCTGASINISSLRKDNASALFAITFKLILAPIMITYGALLLGFRGIELGLIFLMSASPTTTASYVMAKEMGGNAALAANIIALTTVFSMLTCTLGIVFLSSFSLI